MSYTHIDIIARYWRMNGYDTLLPLCFDDNGLPTEKFTEKKHGIIPGEHPPDFKELCMKEASESIDIQTKQLEILGFSYNHRLSYRTIDETCARITQENFLDLIEKGHIKRSYEPMLYCISCQTALSQADTISKEERTTLYYIGFKALIFGEEKELAIATTRPEFLPACGAIFYNPGDNRYRELKGKVKIFNPWDGSELLFLPDKAIDRDFGSGIMMCCTFGDQDDIRYYREHGLPLKEILRKDGKMNENTGILENRSIDEARELMIEFLDHRDFIQKSEDLVHQVSTCERCGIKTEITMSWQWKLDILSFREKIIADARKIKWYPEYMIRRLENWTEGLRWDWIISRQRYYGISIPAWTCKNCGEMIFPSKEELPVDPRTIPGKSCTKCGCEELIPEKDVFDTWMTSSLTPRILHRIYFGKDGTDFTSFDLRPQAHEIIRTWAMYTIHKESITGSGLIPWKNIAISGWGLGFPDKGKRKIKASKSSGSGFDPIDLCKEYGADAFRYWTAQARPGKDQYLNERTLIRGRKLVTKLFNATKITQLLRQENNNGLKERRENQEIKKSISDMKEHLIIIKKDYNLKMTSYNYTDALKLIEKSFWKKYCSEMIEDFKKASRGNELTQENISSLCDYLKEYLKLFAPFMPYITEYCWIITWLSEESRDDFSSIHKIKDRGDR